MSPVNWSTWNPFKPFGREEVEVVRFLREALDGTIDPRAWGDFLDIPMKGTPELEAVRLACKALEGEESMDENGVIIYTQMGRDKLQSLLRSIEK
jgi:hypothetical protein